MPSYLEGLFLFLFTMNSQDWTYTITKSRYGLYTSVLTDGTRMVTGMTEDGVRDVTETIHIPVMKGEFDGYTSTPHKGVVDGKL